MVRNQLQKRLFMMHWIQSNLKVTQMPIETFKKAIDNVGLKSKSSLDVLVVQLIKFQSKSVKSKRFGNKLDYRSLQEKEDEKAMNRLA
jgi:hypothetical protein